MSFENQGFSVIEGVWSAAELSVATELVATLIERHRAGEFEVIRESVSVASVTRQHPSRNPDVIADQMEFEPFIISNLIALEPRFAQLLSAPALWQCASELLNCPLDEVAFHFSNITRKPAYNGPAVGWHRDARNTYFSSEDHRTIRIILPLQKMSRDNGGTEIISGSHLNSISPADISDSEISCPTVLPCSCLVIHAEVLHGGSSNRSDSERDAIIVQFGVTSSKLLYQSDEVLSLSNREGFLRAIHRLK